MHTIKIRARGVNDASGWLEDLEPQGAAYGPSRYDISGPAPVAGQPRTFDMATTTA